ncbi:MAG TPA: ECF transporter S component [Clostridia bacterium]|nr:ECF transporter S component [Clostridia bacterium]
MKNIETKTLILALVMLVVVVLMSALLRIDIKYQEQVSGYWTLGDVGVYLSAVLIGGPLGALVSGLGSALSDIFVGQAIYAPASLVIKAVMAFVFSLYIKKRERAVITLIKGLCLCGGIMVAGYFVYDLLIRGNYVLAAIGLPFNLLQLIGAGLVSLPVLLLAGGKTYAKEDASSTLTQRQLK